MTYTFFFAAIYHNRIDEVQTTLEKYIDPSASYIIGLEKAIGVHTLTEGEHMHFAVEMTDEQYKLFIKTFTYKFNLGGKNSKDKSYYGKEKLVKNENKFLSYTVKDKNIIYKNIDLKTIQEYIHNSFQKISKLTLDEQLLKHLEGKLDLTNDSNMPIEEQIELQILDYMRTNKLKQLPNTYLFKRIIIKFMMQNDKFSNYDIITVIKYYR